MPRSTSNHTAGHFVPYQQPPQQHGLPPMSGIAHEPPRNPPAHPGPQHSAYSQGVDPMHARDSNEVHVKEEHDAALRRERDMRDRQMMEQSHTQQQPQISQTPLHQPVAVGSRSALGPNGLLADTNSGMAPQQPGSSVPASQNAPPPPSAGPVSWPPQPQPPQAVQTSQVPAAASAGSNGQTPILNVGLVIWHWSTTADSPQGCFELSGSGQSTVCKPAYSLQSVFGYHERLQEWSVSSHAQLNLPHFI